MTPDRHHKEKLALEMIYVTVKSYNFIFKFIQDMWLFKANIIASIIGIMTYVVVIYNNYGTKLQYVTIV